MSEREAASLVAAGEEAESSSDEEDAAPAFKPGTVAGEEPETTTDEDDENEEEGEEGDEGEEEKKRERDLPFSTTAAQADTVVTQEQNRETDEEADVTQRPSPAAEERIMGQDGQAVIQAGVAVTVETYVKRERRNDSVCLCMLVGEWKRERERVESGRKSEKEKALCVCALLHRFLFALEIRCSP